MFRRVVGYRKWYETGRKYKVYFCDEHSLDIVQFYN